MQVLIRRNGTMIDVSPDGRSPLPQTVFDMLRDQMWYDYKMLQRGIDAYDPATGQHASIKIERRNLYTLDSYGKLVTGYGFIAKITRILQACGHTVHLQDLSPPRARPRCYEADWENMRRYFTCRSRQEECLQRIDQTLGGIINATMGYGKTKLFSALAHLYPRAKIAIVVKPTDVAVRIVRQLTREFPNVGHMGGGQKLKGDRITVFTAGSMHHSDGDFDFLFCDEAHQLMSPVHSEALGPAFSQSRNYGFTATPTGRLDGAHAKLEMFFGPEIFKLLYPEAVTLGLVVPIRVKWVPVHMSDKVNPANGKKGVPQMRWGIWRNQDRNAVIAQHFRDNYDEDTQALMAVATIDHAIHLWQFLPDFELCYSNIEEANFERYKATKMIPQEFQIMTPARREAMRTAFEEGRLRRVIATDVWSTGVDFSQLQVLYRCDARESEILDSQWPGRVSRLYDGKGHGDLVDFVDMFDNALKRKSLTRKRHYAAHGWAQDWPTGRSQISVIS